MVSGNTCPKLATLNVPYRSIPYIPKVHRLSTAQCVLEWPMATSFHLRAPFWMIVLIPSSTHEDLSINYPPRETMLQDTRPTISWGHIYIYIYINHAAVLVGKTHSSLVVLQVLLSSVGYLCHYHLISMYTWYIYICILDLYLHADITYITCVTIFRLLHILHVLHILQYICSTYKITCI